MKTKIISCKKWPPLDPSQTMIIYDRRLGRVSVEFHRWVKRFHMRYAVHAGEELKDFAKFPDHVDKLYARAKGMSPRTMTVVAVGGGTVGDFAGFFASVYKRGVKLVHIPTTWLAALDSSHGGKTAMNLAGAKNQVGTFHSAESVYLVSTILKALPEVRAVEALGELGKMALIDGGSWVQELMQAAGRSRESFKVGNEASGKIGRNTGNKVGNRVGRPVRGELLWRFLKPAIKAKMKVVRKDPFEKKGTRQVLNLGHTMGHVFEAGFAWPHGVSVAQGIYFALEFSERRNYLKKPERKRIAHLLGETLGLREVPVKDRPRLSARRATELLQRDKKSSRANNVNFVFLKKMGRPLREPVSVTEIITEARRQGWVAH